MNDRGAVLDQESCRSPRNPHICHNPHIMANTVAQIYRTHPTVTRINRKLTTTDGHMHDEGGYDDVDEEGEDVSDETAHPVENRREDDRVDRVWNELKK